ncbi:D-2-hydroxyacid dehydrogenase family protein [Solicola sp. PLA-1-18]|uniref:D-2-hydroxyacid dehydrogenase family protein n=1 Tax=Solicola sp. PLA-1-18 TaxID=3380532 RepID=UPI003B7C9271
MPAPSRVVVLDDYQDCARSYADWESLGTDVDFVHDHLDGDALLDALAGADVVVAMRERTPFDADLLGRLPALRLLVTTGMANASIDVEAARAQGVTVCGTRSLPSPAAEMTWALILAVARTVPRAAADLRDGRWQEAPVGVDLAGATLGLLGLGRLGTRVARVGLAFEMRVQAWSQNLDADHARSLGVEPVTQDVLLATSDVVSLHLRLSDRTRGIVGADELARMKAGALLVNTSRGPLVDEAAMLDALASGHLGGVGLDVYDREPLPPDHPLRSAPRTVLAPHLGYVTDGGYRVFYGDALEDVRAWADDEPVRVL